MPRRSILGEYRHHKVAKRQREILRHFIDQPEEVFLFTDMLKGFKPKPCQPIKLLLVRLLKVVQLLR